MLVLSCLKISCYAVLFHVESQSNILFMHWDFLCRIFFYAVLSFYRRLWPFYSACVFCYDLVMFVTKAMKGVLFEMIQNASESLGLLCTGVSLDLIFLIPCNILFPHHVDYWGGWACFVASICAIGLLTALIGDVAAGFGCTVGLKDSVNSITFIAMGTSLPGLSPSNWVALATSSVGVVCSTFPSRHSVMAFMFIFSWSHLTFQSRPHKNGSMKPSLPPFQTCMPFHTLLYLVTGYSLPDYWGGWLCFSFSIIAIGILTALIGDLAGSFGCTVGLKDSVTAISFVALGTSLPGKDWSLSSDLDLWFRGWFIRGLYWKGDRRSLWSLVRLSCLHSSLISLLLFKCKCS